MKYLIKVWDMFLFVFAYSTTKHCDKLTWGKDEQENGRIVNKTCKDLF